MKKLLLVALVAMTAWGQGSAVNQVQGGPPNSGVYQYFYSGTSITYICFASQLTSLATAFPIAGGLTSIGVATNVGTVNFAATSYLWVGAQIVVSGSTTAALNGTYKVTAVSGSTATITTSGVADATYNNAAMVVSTFNPLLNASVWSIQAFTYSGGNLTGSYFAGAPGLAVASNLACSNRGNY